ncbi:MULTISPECIES: DoxX family protein [Thioclava]|uniref:DoxX family protein n=1 Tax=Thioclava electrotropha TaxID=1549850 RepID=A0ABX6YYY2_9RHOB|nr:MULTISPECIES: DoxX family protein [Thioclava]OOY20021.1 DoxX family protein [Thioclava sp. DLFJ5-1]QPZ92965.1 DoxX family protein [Thioclava electrotropha]
MTDTIEVKTPKQGLFRLYHRFSDVAQRFPEEIVLIGARLFPAMVFWMSGRTKVEGFMIKDSTFTLFQYEYDLPVIPHEWAAVLATFAEHFFPLLLIFGLCSRLAALALLAMTLVIQIFVYPGAWVTHGLWAIALLTVLMKGPGRLSLDKLIGLER